MLGEQIKRCREKRGFTQEQLAEKIGVSIETISSIERGIKMPRLQNFVAIAEFRFSVDKKNCIGLEKRQKQAGADGYLNRTE